MHLITFQITDFQSYRTTQELRLDQHVTILAGRNNVGKTALLRGLRLPVEDHQGTGTGFSLKCAWEFTLDELAEALPDFVNSALRAVGISEPQPRYVVWATLALQLPSGMPPAWNGPSPFVGRLCLQESGIVGTNIRLELIEVPNAPMRIARLWWPDLDAALEVQYWHDLVQAWMNLLNRSLTNYYYIHPRRTGALTALYGVTTQLEPDGSNLTNVVGTLFINHRYTIFQQLETFMRSAFPEISRIDVQMGTSGGQPQATIRVLYGDAPEQLAVPLEYCGTGIEQMLMLASGILTAAAARLFLIDEPHAFLHPAAERSLLRLLQAHPEHQYVIATHSGVFLNAVPLDHVRLITIDGSGSHVNDVRHAAEILTAVGVTATDLWSADALLWIEGPSDVKAVEEMIASMSDLRDVSIRFVGMPDWMRAVSASGKNARAAVHFCDAVREAVTPFKVPSLFVFDGDEKQEVLKESIEQATAGRARFLPVRELENLFLVPLAVQQVLTTLCTQGDLTPPSIEEVTEDMDRLLADTTDRQLYRTDPGGPDLTRVVGSVLLDKLWGKWATTTYDKVAYGPELVKAVNAHEPARLEPLRLLLSELAEIVRAARVMS